MITDITIGQFYPTGSIVHRLDPRVKLLALISYIIFIFITNSFLSLLFITATTLALILLTKVPLKVYLKNIKSIWFIILLTAVLNIFYSEGGAQIVEWWIFDIRWLGVRKAIFMAIRIVSLILISAMLTYTTTPTHLTDAIEKLLSPLKYIGLGNAVHVIAMMMTIALRFIPTLIDETSKLMNAQKARGADFENGGLIKKVKALIPILIPLLISSVRRAFELSEAMESRCYTGSHKRTRMKQLKLSLKDAVAVAFMVVLLSFVIILNYIPINSILTFLPKI